jgi:hypothetical protein
MEAAHSSEPFKDAVSSSGYIVSSDGMKRDSGIWNVEGRGQPNLMYYPGIYLDGLRKTTENFQSE